MTDFKSKTIKQIRIWSWAAAVLPITALAAIFFVWKFFDNSVLGYIMVSGETIMFAVAVVWWWWVMYILRNLVKHWDETRENVKDMLDDVKSMKDTVNSIFKKDK